MWKTECSQCGQECQAADQYSDCCNEPVAMTLAEG